MLIRILGLMYLVQRHLAARILRSTLKQGSVCFISWTKTIQQAKPPRRF